MKYEQTSRLKKRNKKLLGGRGKKRLDFFELILSFHLHKNHQKIFKIRECSSIGANVNICAKSGEKVPPLSPLR